MIPYLFYKIIPLTNYSIMMYTIKQTIKINLSHSQISVLVGALAVSCCPQSAIVGTMSVWRYLFCVVCPFASVLKIESCATGTYEPCQGRKAAALSKHSCVPQGSLVGADKIGNAWKAISNTDARIYYKT